MREVVNLNFTTKVLGPELTVDGAWVRLATGVINGHCEKQRGGAVPPQVPIRILRDCPSIYDSVVLRG
jgi:hypothetical protein